MATKKKETQKSDEIAEEEVIEEVAVNTPEGDTDAIPEKSMFERLAEPFPASEIEWRAGATNQQKTKAMALAYITARAVMDRLDDVIGPGNWQDEYKPGPNGGISCGISIRDPHNLNVDRWVTKWDGAENTNFEGVKGGFSDAFKRAAVKWGIGRYLYKLDAVWVACEQRGKSIVLKATPPLPKWALPSVDSLQDQIDQIAGKPAVIIPPDDDTDPVRNTGKQKPDSQPVGRQVSWPGNVVKALVDAGLAGDPKVAVQMLSQSDLPEDVTAEDAVAHFKSD